MFLKVTLEPLEERNTVFQVFNDDFVTFMEQNLFSSKGYQFASSMNSVNLPELISRPSDTLDEEDFMVKGYKRD